jgi:hypothetical protein
MARRTARGVSARMSLRALAWAWECPDLDASSKLVLLALADHANDDGLSWPSLDRLVERTGRDRRTVQRSILKLERRELVRREPAAGTRSTRYRLPAQRWHDAAPSGGTMPPLAEELEVAPRRPRGGTTPPPRRHHAAPRGGTTPPESSEPSSEPSGESSSRVDVESVAHEIATLRTRRASPTNFDAYRTTVQRELIAKDAAEIVRTIAEHPHETAAQIAQRLDTTPTTRGKTERRRALLDYIDSIGQRPTAPAVAAVFAALPSPDNERTA